MLPEPLLERLAANDDPDGTLAARATAHDRDALAAIAASNLEILARYPPRVVMARILGRRLRRVRVALLLAAVAAIALLVVRLPSPDGEVRTKGTPVLSAFDGASHPLADGAVGSPGDRVQLVLDPAGARYAVVVSVDTRGQITRHFPWPGADTRVARSGAAPLPSSFRLDDTPGWEVFYAVTSDRPLDVDAIVAAARSGAPDRDLPLDLPQVRFVLRKADPAEQPGGHGAPPHP